MNWPKNKPLLDWMNDNPVITIEHFVSGQNIKSPSDEELLQIFSTQRHSLQTWNRTYGVLIDDPHWIGVFKQTSLHTDFRYPRYTHQLLVRCDGFGLTGVGGHIEPCYRGTYVVVDTHSPHKLISLDKNAKYYVGISIDSPVVLDKDATLTKLLDYGFTTSILEGYN